MDPASDTEARMRRNDWAEERKLSGVLKYDALGDSAMIAKGSEKTDGSTNDAAMSHERKQHGWPGIPKEINLQEVGLDSDDKRNASFNSDIRMESDPSRTKNEFETLNADSDVEVPRQRRVLGESLCNSLDNETAA